MKKLISERTAVRALIILLSAVVLFHLLVLFGVIPHDIVWGGRLTDRSQVTRFELISISINLVMIFVVMIRGRIIKAPIEPLILRIALWVMTVLFILNTIGNIISLNNFERYVFTPITLLLAFFCLRLVMNDRKEIID